MCAHAERAAARALRTEQACTLQLSWSSLYCVEVCELCRVTEYVPCHGA